MKITFFRDPGTKLHVVASPTHLVGVAPCQNESFFEEDGVEQWLVSKARRGVLPPAANCY
jgi:hypothetical protein